MRSQEDPEENGLALMGPGKQAAIVPEGKETQVPGLCDGAGQWLP